jgi:uncharacterized membrane protein HdeD (DUF308 family)
MARSTSVEVDRSFFYWRGALGILLGVLILVWPGLTVLTFVTLISIWLLLSGIMRVVQGVRDVKLGGLGWLVTVILGFVELGIGAYLVQRPQLTTLTIITLIGLVIFLQGFVYLVNAFASGGISGGQRMLSFLFAGLSFVAGVWIWRYPLHGTLAFVWLIGLYAIASGGLLMAMGSHIED